MNFRINWDALGISASLACAIHCALLPLLLSSLPVFGVNILHNLKFEIIMILMALVIGFFAFWHGYKKHHHSLLPLLTFAVGLLFLSAKLIWPAYEFWLVLIALLLIVSAHLRNYRYCRLHNHAHGDDCNH